MNGRYKHTELGWIPKDWEVKKFSDFASKSDKWSITGGPFGSDLKVSDYTEKGVRIIQLQNIGDGVFIDDYKIFTSSDKADKLKSSNVYPGDIILSKMGDPVARACFIPTSDTRFVMASDGIRLSVDEKKFNRKFVHEYINSSFFRKRAKDVSTGTTRQRIGLPNLKKITIIAPPLPEQKAIADCLSTWDKAIELQIKLIRDKEERKKALKQQLLTGKKRLPGFNDDWKEYQLKTFLEEYDSKSNETNNLPVFTSSKNGLMMQLDYYSGGRMTNRDNVDYNILPKDHLTYRSRSDDGLFTFNINDKGFDGLISGYYPVFKIIKGDIIFFLYFLNFFKEKLTKYSSGTSQLVLSFTSLKRAKFNLPSFEEQNAIADILKITEKEIQLEKQKLDNLKEQKKSLMQQLLTGKVRLINLYKDFTNNIHRKNQ